MTTINKVYTVSNIDELDYGVMRSENVPMEMFKVSYTDGDYELCRFTPEGDIIGKGSDGDFFSVAFLGDDTNYVASSCIKLMVPYDTLTWQVLGNTNYRPGDVYKPTTHTTHKHTQIMSFGLMIGALRKGNTGDQILEILDALVGLQNDIEILKELDSDPMEYGTLGDTEF